MEGYLQQRTAAHAQESSRYPWEKQLWVTQKRHQLIFHDVDAHGKAPEPLDLRCVVEVIDDVRVARACARSVASACTAARGVCARAGSAWHGVQPGALGGAAVPAAAAAHRSAR